VLLLAIVPGCQVFHNSRPEPVEVRDAETNKPIPGASVRISYPLENPAFAPSISQSFTAEDGIARLQAAPFGRAGVMVDVNAKGYMSEQKVLTVEEVKAVEPAHWFEDVSRRPASLVMKMYAEPHVTIELIVPAGYRGQVKATIDVGPDSKNPSSPQAAPLPAFEPGQRLFSYAVAPSGVVDIIGPPLFRHVTPASLSVKFADNFPICKNAAETTIGYWWIKCENHCHYLLIGTQGEHDSFSPPPRAPGNSDKQSSGGGQGRHGRKGNQPPADAGP